MITRKSIRENQISQSKWSFAPKPKDFNRKVRKELAKCAKVSLRVFRRRTVCPKLLRHRLQRWIELHEGMFNGCILLVA